MQKLFMKDKKRDSSYSVTVIKRDGSEEKFDKSKVIKAVCRTECDQETIDYVLKGIKPILKDGVETSKIYDRVFKLLKKRDPVFSYRYQLKESLGKLKHGERFEFERYVQQLFDALGFEAVWHPKKAQGFCIDHEIDVYLPNEKIYIECKHHGNPHRGTGLGDAIETWARLDDIKNGYKKGVKGSKDIKDFWLVTNTKFSEHAKRYAKCKNMTLIGWRSPVKSLEKLIEKSKCYPITMLPITDKEHNKLSDVDILNTLTFKEEFERSDGKIRKILSHRRAKELYLLCQQI